ncbi:hypothetical protein BY458DRAFT_326258 [Sporodiniella umbellata]|nr:hypothetical protein BY458DRAFT_326258 [Sporodiniella umbellata]
MFGRKDCKDKWQFSTHSFKKDLLFVLHVKILSLFPHLFFSLPMSNTKKKLLPSWVLRLLGVTSLATVVVSFAVYWFKNYSSKRKISSNERNPNWSNKLFKSRKNKKKMTISLKNTILWNPSCDVGMYAFQEDVVQLLHQISHLYEVYIVVQVSSEEEHKSIQSLLENAQGGLFSVNSKHIDQRKIVYCSEEEGKMHIIRHIEPAVHIEGGWEKDDGEDVVRKLRPFVSKIIWILPKRRIESILAQKEGSLGQGVELSEKLMDSFVFREVAQSD